MRMTLLGGFRLERDGKPVKLPTRKTESLLAYLALRRGPHARRALARLLWGDAPDEHARRSLRVAFSALRKALGDAIFADASTAQWNHDAICEVDALAFESSVMNLATADDLVEATSAALMPYAGELLAGYYDDWIAADRERYRSLYVGALLRLIAHHRDQGAYAAAIDAAGRLLRTDPANELAHRQLMLCHAALGDRAAALLQFEKCRQALEEELGVAPSKDTLQLLAAIQAPAPQGSVAARLINLPRPLTSFVGRHEEMDSAGRLLANERLITLTGAGGSGKTRLALELARALAETFEHGAAWVDLAPVGDPGLVAGVTARSLGMLARDSSSADVAQYLHERQLLLILDGCERLLAPVAALAERVLAECPRVSLLLTSREPLNVAGEVAWHVPPLALPEAFGTKTTGGAAIGRHPAFLMRHAAVRLFVERATAAHPAFQLTAENAPDVVALCRRLDGLPLALELAAAQTRAFTLAQIAQRLNQRLDLPADPSSPALPRQRTLRGLVEWSHDLLTEDERTLYRRLGAFAGGFTLEAAEPVCGAFPLTPQRVMDLLARLVDQSLVILRPEADGRSRYGLLEILRAHASEKLAESNEAVAIAARHADLYGALAADGVAALMTSRLADVHARMAAEIDNLRAALGAAFGAGDTRQALRLCRDLGPFWFWRGYAGEGRAACARALALARAHGDNSDTLYASVALQAGRLADQLGDAANARAWVEEGRLIAEQAGDPAALALAADSLAMIEIAAGRPAEALACANACIRLARRAGHPIARLLPEDDAGGWATVDPLALKATASALAKEQDRSPERTGSAAEALSIDVASAINDIGLAQVLLGDLTAARGALSSSLIVREAAGNTMDIAISCSNLGYVLLLQGEAQAAVNTLERALRLQEADQSVYGAWPILQNLAIALNALGSFDRAAEMAIRCCRDARDYGIGAGVFNGLTALLVIEANRGSDIRAATLLGVTERMSESGQNPLLGYERQLRDEAVSRIAAALGPADLAAAVAAGRAMSEDAVVAMISSTPDSGRSLL